MSAFTVGFGAQPTAENPQAESNLLLRPGGGMGLGYPMVPSEGAQGILQQMGIQFPQRLSDQMMFQHLAEHHARIAHALQGLTLGGGAVPGAPMVSGAGSGIGRLMQGVAAVPEIERQYKISQILAPYQLAGQTAGLRSALTEEKFRQQYGQFMEAQAARDQALMQRWGSQANVEQQMEGVRQELADAARDRNLPTPVMGPQGYEGQLVPAGGKPEAWVPAPGGPASPLGAQAVGKNIKTPSFASGNPTLWKTISTIAGGDPQKALKLWQDSQVAAAGGTAGARTAAATAITEPQKALSAFVSDQRKTLQKDPKLKLAQLVPAGKLSPGMQNLVDLSGKYQQYLTGLKPGDQEQTWDQYLQSHQATANQVKQVAPHLKPKDVHSVTNQIVSKQLSTQKKAVTPELVGVLMNRFHSDRGKVKNYLKSNGYPVE